MVGWLDGWMAERRARRTWQSMIDHSRPRALPACDAGCGKLYQENKRRAAEVSEKRRENLEPVSGILHGKTDRVWLISGCRFATNLGRQLQTVKLLRGERAGGVGEAEIAATGETVRRNDGPVGQRQGDIRRG